MHAMKYLPAATTILLLAACGGGPSELPEEASTRFDPRVRNAIYDTVTLSTDLDALSENERRMIPLLIQAAQQMDRLFWLESWGPPDVLPGNGLDADQLRFFTINYGPWDRLAGDAPFIDGIGAKPLGARFYPADIDRKSVV